MAEELGVLQEPAGRDALLERVAADEVVGVLGLAGTAGPSRP
jgi:hypothetical protein